MASKNRASLIAKLHKVLEKHYRPVPTPDDRTILEHLIYGLLLENAAFDKADEAFARLQTYFDWNEVRVSSVGELSEALTGHPAAGNAASQVKTALYNIYEDRILKEEGMEEPFDLEWLKKEKLGAAAKTLEGWKGITPFAIGYVVQHGLGGHAIPLDQALLDTLFVVGVIDEKERSAGEAPGLDRAIPKAKGPAFASQIHQLAVDYFHTPFSNKIRGILTEVDPEAKQRFPKRGQAEDESARARKRAKRLKAKQRAAEAAAETKASPEKPSAPAKKSSGKTPTKATAPKKGSEKAAGPSASPPKPDEKKAVKKNAAPTTKKKPAPQSSGKSASGSTSKQLKKRKPK